MAISQVSTGDAVRSTVEGFTKPVFGQVESLTDVTADTVGYVIDFAAETLALFIKVPLFAITWIPEASQSIAEAANVLQPS